jgi:nitrogen-specific signal transduction histidine kinase/PAS domain-containing protein
MGQPSKPNGGSQGTGNRDALAKIARLISIGDEPEAANDADAAQDGAEQPAEAMESLPSAEHRTGDKSLNELGSSELLEALPAGLAIYRDAELVDANSAFALAFGYGSVEELKAAGGLYAVFPDGLGKLSKDTAKSTRKSSAPVKLDARSCSGRTFRIPVAVHDAPDGQGEPMRLMVLHPDGSIFADQAESFEAPERLEAKERREDDSGDGGSKPPRKKKKPVKKKQKNVDTPADIRDTEFLVMVSHELRTPLNSIIGFAEIMKDEQLGPIGNDRYRGYIRDILDSGVYALSLVNDLLDISKIESGEFELNFAAVDLEEVIAESVHSMQPQAQKQRVLLRTSFAEGLPPALADRRSIRQIILNLVSNAIKFTRPGGQVIVSTQATGAGGVRIRVRDTGIGMTKNEIEVAMKPYRQVDPSPQGNAGAGLGLPLTKALVEANRARFKVRSISKAGTRIDVTFPKDRVAEPRD